MQGEQVGTVRNILRKFGIGPEAAPVDVRGLMEQVDALLEENRWRHAIELLVDRNRGLQLAEIEKRLVDLRLQAAEHMEFVPSPRLSDDGVAPGHSFEFEDSIPVLPATALDAAALRRAIEGHGHLIVRNYLSAEAIQPLRDAIDSALAARVAAYGGAPRTGGEAWYYESPHFPGGHVPYSRRLAEKRFTLIGSIWAIDSPRASFRLMELYRQLGLPALLREFFSDAPLIATRKWMLRLAEPRQDADDGIGGGWHQDGQFMGESVRTLNLWLSLSDCGDGTGAPGIALIPRRMREIVEYGTRGAKLDWTVGVDLVAEIAETAPVVRPRFRPGDALFFDHLSLHRTGRMAAQTQNRYAVESWFYAASAHGGRPVMPMF